MMEESAWADVEPVEKGQQSPAKADESSIWTVWRGKSASLHQGKKSEITQLTLKSNKIKDL